MSDSAIRPGDMVMVVRACCERNRRVLVGTPFVVVAVGQVEGGFCQMCGKESGRGASWAFAGSVFARDEPFMWNSAPLEWLQKINGKPAEQGDKTERPVKEAA